MADIDKVRAEDEGITVVYEERPEEGGTPAHSGGEGVAVTGGSDGSTTGGGTVATESGEALPDRPAEDYFDAEDGAELDGDGNVTNRFRIETVHYQDGSTSWTRTDTYTTGDKALTTGESRPDRSGSYTTTMTYADGTGLITTRTHDPRGRGHQTETWIDANGNPVREQETDF
jgi:hypothetical protein